MDMNWFEQAMKKQPGQGTWEWQMFLEFIEAYFKNREINPIVVEIGTRRNRQKGFYEHILKARHIGIDRSSHFSKPDILGDSKDIKTLEVLKEMLDGQNINLLFIDGDHSYEGAKSDYEMYGPLAKDIIAFHDISARRLGVYKLWADLVTHDDSKSAKRSIRIGYATGLIMLGKDEKIYDRIKNYDKYF